MDCTQTAKQNLQHCSGVFNVFIVVEATGHLSHLTHLFL